MGRLFDDCRGDSIGGCWRGGFLFFRGAGALLGACTNARLGFIRGMFIGNQGSRGFLQEVQTPLAIKDCNLLECERESEVTHSQVRWPILGIRALHLPIQVHTQSSEHTHTHTHTHTENTHPEQWAAIYAAAPGEQLGVWCLAQEHLVVGGYEGGESAVHSPPHLQFLPDLRLELATFGLWVRLSNHVAPFTRSVSVNINASRLLWMEWRQALPNWIVGLSHRVGSVARGRSWKHLNFLNANAGVSQSDWLMQISLHRQSRSCNTRKRMWLAVVTMTVAPAPSFRHALCQALTPTPRVNVPLGHNFPHVSVLSFLTGVHAPSGYLAGSRGNL